MVLDKLKEIMAENELKKCCCGCYTNCRPCKSNKSESCSKEKDSFDNIVDAVIKDINEYGKIRQAIKNIGR